MGDVLTPAFELFEAASFPFAPKRAGWALEILLSDRRLCALTFCRHAPLGPYLVDFFCPAHRLVIDAAALESLHADRRDAWLKRRGYKVLKACDWAMQAQRETLVAAIVAACGLSW
jgi:very-short-patch-repair endonuclease